MTLKDGPLIQRRENNMIVKIEFTGIVGKDKLKDTVSIHAESKEQAREVLTKWILAGLGIRGDSNVFHPLGEVGRIQVVKEK